MTQRKVHQVNLCPVFYSYW